MNAGESKTKVLPTHTPSLMEAAVLQAADLLKAGELVALPTETVYGLAANAFDSNAVARIYRAKGRPPTNPIIVHVADRRMARQCVRHWPRAAERLARSFWPGPLTMVLPRAGCIPGIVTAGGETVGVRCPDHPVIQGVIRACGFPLAAPSANISNRLSATTADHVCQNLAGKVKLVLDGGPCSVGIESTVIDLTSDPPRVLRPGVIHELSLAAVLGRDVLLSETADLADIQRSPGRLPRHYAPKTRLFVWRWKDEASLNRMIVAHNLVSEHCHVITHLRPPTMLRLAGVNVLPRQVRCYARSLYAALHECDAACPAAIIVRAPPDTPQWRAIADRLKRASGPETSPVHQPKTSKASFQ